MFIFVLCHHESYFQSDLSKVQNRDGTRYILSSSSEHQRPTGVPLQELEKGCQVKIKKKELENHEKEDCWFTEKLQCPGCKTNVSVFSLKDNLRVALRQIKTASLIRCLC